jgi:hypothetical protein
MFKWLADKGWRMNERQITEVCLKSQWRHLGILKWIKENGYPNKMCKAAAGGDRQREFRPSLEVVRWAWEEEGPWTDAEGDQLMWSAVYGRSLEIMDWVYDQKKNKNLSSELYLTAQSNKRRKATIEIFDFLEIRECPLIPANNWKKAFMNKDENVLKWLLKRDPLSPWLWIQAMESTNQVFGLEWLKKKNCPRDDTDVFQYTHKDQLKWLTREGLEHPP